MHLSQTARIRPGRGVALARPALAASRPLSGRTPARPNSSLARLAALRIVKPLAPLEDLLRFACGDGNRLTSDNCIVPCNFQTVG